MRRILMMILLLLVPLAARADSLLVPLSDPVDQAVQRLNIMSQQDAAFEGFPYNNGYLAGRGCQAASVANAVIAAFGVEDRETAIEVVRETTSVLVVPHKKNSTRIELTRLPLLMDAQLRAEQAEEYPVLAKVIGGYGGEISILERQADTQAMEALMREIGGAFVLSSRMTVHPDWTAMIELMALLDEMGMDDAWVCLANVGVGSEKSGMPLSLGENGHYLTVMMHVSTFMREGRIYVLDSLPRALDGEESGLEHVLRAPYPFTQGWSQFAGEFSAQRIRDTVIRLSLRDTGRWIQADAGGKARILSRLTLFGPGVLMIAAP